MAPAAKEFYEDQKNLNKLCNFLRSADGPAVREAIMMDKRVYYIKGEKLVNFMVEPKKGTKWPKELPRFSSRPDAIAVCKELCNIQYIHRSEKVAKGELEVARVRDFDESAYFTWIYEGDMTNKNLMTTALIIGFLCCTCFPIWPNFLKVFVWYMSVSLLIFIFFLVTLRALLFLFVWIIGYEMWFLPNLFDESLGFCESFVPVISCEKTKDGQLMYRVGVFVAFFSFCYWAVTQPSEFDGFVKGQGDFIKDLYAGTLLSDMSQKDKENIDKPKMPSLEDLLKKLDSADEEEEKELSEEEAAEALLDSLVEDEEEIYDDEE
jgi:translocation protein SEC62